MPDLLLEARNLGKAYHGHTVVEHVSLQLLKGEIITVIGPNGAGKSTLLKLLLGLEAPDYGDLIRPGGVRIGYLPQHMTVHPTMPLSVHEFLKLYAPHARRVAALAERFAIEDLLGKPVEALSGGEWRRVLLARAMLRQPDLLVLDEPLAGIDVNGQAALYELIDDVVNAEGCGVLMVSHDLHMVMASTHHVICLNRHICCEGEPRQLGENPAFTNLFGKDMAQRLALYSHTHDHTHDLHGNVIAEPKEPVSHDYRIVE